MRFLSATRMAQKVERKDAPTSIGLSHVPPIETHAVAASIVAAAAATPPPFYLIRSVVQIHLRNPFNTPTELERHCDSSANDELTIMSSIRCLKSERVRRSQGY